MNWFNNLRVRVKLLGGFSVVLLMMAALGIFSVSMMNRVNGTSTEMADVWMPSMQAIGGMNTALGELRIAQFEHVRGKSAAEKDASEKDMKVALADLDRHRAIYEPLYAVEEERTAYGDFKARLESLLGAHQGLVAASRANRTDEAMALLSGDTEKHYDAASAVLDRIVEMNAKSGQAASDLGDKLYDDSRLAVSVMIVVSVIVGMLIALLIARLIASGLSHAAAAAEAIASGDLSGQIEVKSRDETGQLLAAMKRMQATLSGLIDQTRTVVGAASRGDFTGRVDESGMQGFQLELAGSVNSLVGTTES